MYTQIEICQTVLSTCKVTVTVKVSTIINVLFCLYRIKDEQGRLIQDSAQHS
jgi:hypothetical protein